MCDNNILLLPVSVGEGLDKLSILDIKLDNIKDSRRVHVETEYNLLFEKLDIFIKNSQVDKYYKMIKKTNNHIWKLMDLLRDGINIDDITYTKLCKETIIANDIRFRIKNKINNTTNSILKEQKGYKCLKILIDLSNYTGNYDVLVKPLYYYSILYDEIYIKSYDKNLTSFINKEFNMSIIIIDTIDSIDQNTIYEKSFYIVDNCDINSQLEINNEDLNIYL